LFYSLKYDMESINKKMKAGTNPIFAETSNISLISSAAYKKGFFSRVIYAKHLPDVWPRVEFYYSSKVSDREEEYLLNAEGWPIVHEKVKETFEKAGIDGVIYLPVYLVDVVTERVNDHYYLLYTQNIIDGFDMEKSEYRYNEEYNFYVFLPHATYLDKNACEKYDVFRCEKSVAPLYVSQKIKDLVKKHRWKGFDFFVQRTNE